MYRSCTRAAERLCSQRSGGRSTDEVEPVAEWTGRETRALRIGLRMTIEGFAEHLGVAARTVAKWEARGGMIVPVPTIQDLLDSALERATPTQQSRFEILRFRGRPPSGATSGPPGETDTGDAKRWTLLYGILTEGGLSLNSELMAAVERTRQAMDRTIRSGSVTTAQMNQIEERTQRRACLCVNSPPVEMLCRLVLDFAEVAQLVGARQRFNVQRRLYAVAAQSAALVADELMVLGATEESWAWHRTSKTAADTAGDPALRAHVRTLGALLPLYYGDPESAVVLTREARKILGRGLNPSSAMAPVLESYALALLGDIESSTQALHEAAEAFEGLPSQDRCESVLGFSERRWHFYVSRIVSHLASESAAKTLGDALAQSHALTLYPPEVIGDPALIQLDRAICLVRLADIPEGCQLAGKVLGNISAKQRTKIIRRRVGDVLA